MGRQLIAAATDMAGERGSTEIASDALIDNLLGERPHRSRGFVEVERAIHFRKDRQAAAPPTPPSRRES